VEESVAAQQFTNYSLEDVEPKEASTYWNSALFIDKVKCDCQILRDVASDHVKSGYFVRITIATIDPRLTAASISWRASAGN